MEAKVDPSLNMTQYQLNHPENQQMYKVMRWESASALYAWHVA